MKMTDREFAAYLAGFTDGEGYIGCEPAKHGRPIVRIAIANTDIRPLQFILDRLGFGKIRSQQQQANWKVKYCWHCSNLSDAEKFFDVCQEFLIVKVEAVTKARARIAEAKARHLHRTTRNEEIKAAVKNGEGNRKEIAARFNVSPQTVSRLCEGHKWPSQQKELASTRHRDSRGLFVPVQSKS